MNANNILSADILDIIFENKNKAYGAYDLRKTYNKRLVLALGGTMAFCLMFFLSMAFTSRNKKQVEKPKVIDYNLASVNEPKEKAVELPKEQSKPQEQIASVKNIVPKIVPDAEVKPEDEVKTVDELDNARISIKNQDGKDDPNSIGPVTEIKGTGLITTEIKKEEDYTKVFPTVQLQARFPGGLDAWRKFLERNLNSTVPVDNGASLNTYTVIVSFIVDRDGNVSEVRAETDPGFGMAAEAIRVIKKSNRWEPAEQNGHKVIYRQKQAIVFKVLEE